VIKFDLCVKKIKKYLSLQLIISAANAKKQQNAGNRTNKIEYIMQQYKIL